MTDDMALQRPLPEQPIPDSANRVFEGKIFSTYQWPQQLYNGKIVTFEAIKRPDSVNVLPITSEGKIIITEQEQPGMKPFIGALGGRVDENETPLEAAERELHEEAGLMLNDLSCGTPCILSKKLIGSFGLLSPRIAQRLVRSMLMVAKRLS